MESDAGELFTSISCAVFAAGRYAFPPNWRLNPGAIPHYRLFVATAGRATFGVGGATHVLEEGGVILVPPHVTHHARQDRARPLTAYVIDFEAKLHGILDVAEFCGLPVSLMPGEIRRPKVASSAESITRHLTYLMPGYQLALHTHCVRLLDLLWKETLTLPRLAVKPGARAADLQRFRPVFQLVEQRFGERLTLQQLAAAVHLHPAYFSASFKRAAGLGPHEYLNRYRLERARDLLVASDTPLHEIARRTGFCDAAHLIRVFRRLQGTSPGRYRRTHSMAAARPQHPPI
ncbi:MAG TPA: AraC family transcriptional regulator [Chloroflexota bacterium]|nr:AraC family transcriptional regulator [Chloroflexota bacterium]